MFTVKKEAAKGEVYEWIHTLGKKNAYSNKNFQVFIETREKNKYAFHNLSILSTFSPAALDKYQIIANYNINNIKYHKY